MTSGAHGGRSATYDRIGVGYREVRRPDPRPASLIGEALAGARTVVNIVAEAGSYGPADAEVTAVDPSQVRLDQHPGPREARAVAEELPFVERQFDTVMAVMTVHHWSDARRGPAEMGRVSRRQTVFTWDPGHERELWMVSEYLPEIRETEHGRCPALAEVVGAAVERLRADLASGSWARRHADLLSAESVDHGYRLVVTGG
ncbi:class I SAM-dependent methyltransferase [Streptomyces thermolineatus]|uniref:class I SAM-dependent methyltransferase n=1 Tax=Streptomyces thermolineatus TaxID=44033 RepID=UPI00384D30AF